MFENFTHNALVACDRARVEAAALGSERAGTEHILLSLAKTSGNAQDALAVYGLSYDDILKRMSKTPTHGTATDLDATRMIFTANGLRALQIAGDDNPDVVDTEHVLIALLDTTDSVAQKILTSVGLDDVGVTGVINREFVL